MQGSCLCGHVAFRVDPPLRDVIGCHCTQCRKTSGHFWAASSVPMDRFHLLRNDGLAWFRSSDTARRGFCKDCGASLFWAPADETRISFAAGALDGQTGLRMDGHWHLADAGDYYAPAGPATGSDAAPETLRASCLCGANRFTLPGPMGQVIACHCAQCRKTSGHFAASFDADEGDVQWEAKVVREHTTNGGGRRGFCPACGSSLYFRAVGGEFSIEAGAVDTPTGGQLTEHIFTADKGDYYTLDDGLPQTS